MILLGRSPQTLTEHLQPPAGRTTTKPKTPTSSTWTTPGMIGIHRSRRNRTRHLRADPPSSRDRTSLRSHRRVVLVRALASTGAVIFLTPACRTVFPGLQSHRLHRRNSAILWPNGSGVCPLHQTEVHWLRRRSTKTARRTERLNHYFIISIARLPFSLPFRTQLDCCIYGHESARPTALYICSGPDLLSLSITRTRICMA